MTNAAITGVGHSLPEQAITSPEVEDLINAASSGFTMPRGMIELVSGVRERRHAPAGTTSSDLAARAGLAALADADADPASVELLIFASASHDVSEPATAAIVQDKTGCRGATFVDVKNACNSFLNALDFASAMIAAGRARRILITSGEMLSPTINWQIDGLADLPRRFAAFTIGDVGAAVLLDATDDDRGLLPARFVSDGSHWHLSTVLFGGTLMGLDTSRWYFEADSAQLQKLALAYLPDLLDTAMTAIGWQPDDLAFVVPHQVSQAVIEGLCAAMDFPLERCLVTLDQFGNTAAASIPLALSLAAEQNRLRRHDRILLVSGAAGFTAGVLPVIW